MLFSPRKLCILPTVNRLRNGPKLVEGLEERHATSPSEGGGHLPFCTYWEIPAGSYPARSQNKRAAVKQRNKVESPGPSGIRPIGFAALMPSGDPWTMA
jgi:hypothetical protein